MLTVSLPNSVELKDVAEFARKQNCTITRLRNGHLQLVPQPVKQPKKERSLLPSFTFLEHEGA